MNTLKIALIAAASIALPVIGCAAGDLPEEGPAVQTEQGVDPAAKTGAIIGTSGTIVTISPGTIPPGGTPPISCPSVCERSPDGKYCSCPHGFGIVSGASCPYGKQFLCINLKCQCY